MQDNPVTAVLEAGQDGGSLSDEIAGHVADSVDAAVTDPRAAMIHLAFAAGIGYALAKITDGEEGSLDVFAEQALELVQNRHD